MSRPTNNDIIMDDVNESSSSGSDHQLVDTAGGKDSSQEQIQSKASKSDADDERKSVQLTSKSGLQSENESKQSESHADDGRGKSDEDVVEEKKAVSPTNKSGLESVNEDDFLAGVAHKLWLQFKSSRDAETARAVRVMRRQDFTAQLRQIKQTDTWILRVTEEHYRSVIVDAFGRLPEVAGFLLGLMFFSVLNNSNSGSHLADVIAICSLLIFVTISFSVSARVAPYELRRRVFRRQRRWFVVSLLTLFIGLTSFFYSAIDLIDDKVRAHAIALATLCLFVVFGIAARWYVGMKHKMNAPRLVVDPQPRCELPHDMGPLLYHIFVVVVFVADVLELPLSVFFGCCANRSPSEFQVLSNGADLVKGKLSFWERIKVFCALVQRDIDISWRGWQTMPQVKDGDQTKKQKLITIRKLKIEFDLIVIAVLNN